MRYLLKYKDRLVAEFSLNAHEYVFHICNVNVLNEELLPFSVKKHKDSQREALTLFLETRCMPYERRHIDALLSSLGLSGKSGNAPLLLGIMTGFASGFDSYYITPKVGLPKESFDTPLGDDLFIPREYLPVRSDSQDWKEVLCTKTPLSHTAPDYATTLSLTIDSYLPSWWEDGKLKQLIDKDEIKKYAAASEKLNSLDFIGNTYSGTSCVLSSDIPAEDIFFAGAIDRNDKRLGDICMLMRECRISSFQVGFCPETDKVIVIY